MKIIPYILYLFLIAFHHTIFSELTSIYGAAIDLTVLLVALIAIYKGEVATLWFAFAAGIVAGTPRPDLMPWEILILCVGAIIINRLISGINLESITSRLVIIGGFLFFHAIAINLVLFAGEFLYVLWRSIIPGTVYSLIIAWLILLCFDGRITWTKIKALFYNAELLH